MFIVCCGDVYDIYMFLLHVFHEITPNSFWVFFSDEVFLVLFVSLICV